MSPMIKLESGMEEDRRSLKNEKKETIGNFRDDIEADDEHSIDEELLDNQHNSDLSLLEEDEEDWYTLIGIVVLLVTLFGVSSIGVVANLVPASSGFVQMAQRSGFVFLATLVPAYFETSYFKTEIVWHELFSWSSLSFSLFTTSMLLFWQTLFIEGVQVSTQVQGVVLSNLHGSVILILNVIFGVRPLKTEQTGFLFSVIGSVLVYYDPLAKRVDNHMLHKPEVIRLVLSSFFGAAYMIFNEKNTH
jgi:hypothetical protein